MGESEVGAAVALYLFHLLLGRNLLAEPIRILFAQRLVGKRKKLTVNAEFRRHVRADVKVAAAFIDRSLQKLIHRNIHLNSPYLLFTDH